MIVLLASAACGCSESTEPGFDDVDVQGPTVNPDGIAYPTADLGGRARAGETPGQRFPNFAFHGYPDSDRSKGLQVVSLADYFDPGTKRFRVLHIMAGVAWCPHCQAQTEQMVQAMPALRLQGAVSIQTLMEGHDPDAPITLGDMDRWVSERSTNFTVVFDVEGKRLGTVEKVAAVPFNALIDLRTMEVLAAEVGEPEAGFASFVQQGLDWVKANPPRD
jgi:hypothetical protein